MIAFREASVGNPVFHPSDFWRMTNRYMSYIRELSVEQLENIRCHVGMGFFLGNPWDKDFYAGIRATTDADAAKLPLVSSYLRYTESLPQKYWISECETTDLVAAIGVRHDKRLITSDIVKEQASIATLYNLGLLDALDDDALVMEVGPGYGQLALQLSRACGGNCRFVLVDYPETLFWSGVFIALNAPPDRVYIWKPGDEAPDIESLGRDHKFILIPNFSLEASSRTRAFDLIVNSNSFQEMTEQQVSFYAQFAADTASGWLYSYNANRPFMNRQLESNVASILRRHFRGGPDDRDWEALGPDLQPPDAKRLFVGHSRALTKPPPRHPKSRIVWISGKPFELDPESIAANS